MDIKTITYELGEDWKLQSSADFTAYVGEHDVLRVLVKTATEANAEYSMDICTYKQRVKVTMTETTGGVYFDLTRSILNGSGELTMQLVANYADGKTKKSSIVEQRIRTSINASEEAAEDDPDLIEQVLTQTAALKNEATQAKTQAAASAASAASSASSASSSAASASSAASTASAAATSAASAAASASASATSAASAASSAASAEQTCTTFSQAIDDATAAASAATSAAEAATQAANDAAEAVGDLEDAVSAQSSDIANLSATKVGYSEVQNGRLMMYADSTKTTLLANIELPTGSTYDDTEIRGEIDALDEGKADADHVHTYAEIQETPTIPDAVDVQINGTSITSGGVANIPIATGNALGVVKPYEWSGIKVDANGTLSLKQNSESDITNNRNNAGNASSKFGVTYDRLDYAVKSALCDGRGAAYTASEQLAARQRLGIEKEWVLKGTISGTADDRGNIDTGVSVDLTGCTELAFKGSILSTGATSIGTNKYNIVNAVNAISNGYVKGLFEDDVFGSRLISCKIGNSTAVGTSQSGFDWVNGTKVRDINLIKFGVPSAVTSCNIQIYAR